MTRTRRKGWLASLAVVPAAGLALLPSFTCPACLAAYAGVFSTIGLGFMLNERVMAPLIAAFLVIGFLAIARSTRSHRRPGPLVATGIGSVVVVVGRLVWNIPSVLYVGVALLVAAAVWNLWLKRPKRRPLVQLATVTPPTPPGEIS